MQKALERILNLLAFLLTAEQPVTAAEIRHTVAGYDQDKDESFRRMFERDKDLLRSLGIPLELQPMDAWEVEHGYVVPRDAYALADPGLTDEERVALWLAAQAVRIGGQAPGPDALLKLGGAPFTGSGEPLAADLGSDTDALGQAFVAVTERRHLEFDYRGTHRRLAPYGIVHRRGHWYLVGAEVTGEGAVKAFRLDRSSGVVAVGKADSFKKPRRFRAGDYIPSAPWEAGPEDVTATVEFDASIAWWARRQLGSATAVQEQADGGLVATLPVANTSAFIGWVLAFDDHAEVLGPPQLREQLVNLLRVA